MLRQAILKREYALAVVSQRALPTMRTVAAAVKGLGGPAMRTPVSMEHILRTKKQRRAQILMAKG